MIYYGISILSTKINFKKKDKKKNFFYSIDKFQKVKKFLKF